MLSSNPLQSPTLSPIISPRGSEDEDVDLDAIADEVLAGMDRTEQVQNIPPIPDAGQMDQMIPMIKQIMTEALRDGLRRFRIVPHQLREEFRAVLSEPQDNWGAISFPVFDGLLGEEKTLLVNPDQLTKEDSELARIIMASSESEDIMHSQLMSFASRLIEEGKAEFAHEKPLGVEVVVSEEEIAMRVSVLKKCEIPEEHHKILACHPDFSVELQMGIFHFFGKDPTFLPAFVDIAVTKIQKPESMLKKPSPMDDLLMAERLLAPKLWKHLKESYAECLLALVKVESKE